MNQHYNTYSVKSLVKSFDYILIFFLFGIAVTMIAGAGATFEESYNIPTWLGSFNYDISDLYYVAIRL